MYEHSAILCVCMLQGPVPLVPNAAAKHVDFVDFPTINPNNKGKPYRYGLHAAYVGAHIVRVTAAIYASSKIIYVTDQPQESATLCSLDCQASGPRAWQAALPW